MPLVVICGYPCSGKSHIATRLQHHLETVEKRRVTLVTDDECLPGNQLRNRVYGDPGLEKLVRGQLKSEVQRSVGPESVVILDSYNYIKGFRYELFCVVKALQTPHCVVFCDTSSDICRQRNSQRSLDSPNRYPDDLLEALIQRFEPPQATSRWDSPLIRHTPEEEGLDVERLVCDAVLRRVPPPPNQSTQSQPLSSTNFLQELDHTTHALVLHLMREQNSCQLGGEIVLPSSNVHFQFSRRVTLAELQRARRQFLVLMKSRPNEDLDQCRGLFVQYLNNTIT